MYKITLKPNQYASPEEVDAALDYQQILNESFDWDEYGKMVDESWHDLAMYGTSIMTTDEVMKRCMK